MSKDIYKMLGFKKGAEFIYSSQIIRQLKDLFAQFPFKHLEIRPLLVEQAVFEESLAISTSEDSQLTLSEAKKIQLTEEQEARLAKYRSDKQLDDREKYERLEFENIRAVENQMGGISFEDLNVSFVCNLHNDLTLGLDEYGKVYGVSHYHSGSLRRSNQVRVGKIRSYVPPDYKDIKKMLNVLFVYFSKKKSPDLYDILEFHILFYALHPFQNGNKRVARLLESMLLDHYGYGEDRILSLSVYYSEKKSDYHFFLMSSLRHRDIAPFVNFAVRGYFFAVFRIIQETFRSYFLIFRDNFEQYIKASVKAKQVKHYENAKETIIYLRGVFTHTVFVEEMKKRGSTIGISQVLLQGLIKKGFLRKKGKQYYLGLTLEMDAAVEKLNAFFVKQNIDVRAY